MSEMERHYRTLSDQQIHNLGGGLMLQLQQDGKEESAIVLAQIMLRWVTTWKPREGAR